MISGLQHTHNLLRWLLLLFLLLTIFTALRGYNGKKPFTDGDKRTALYLLICADIQLLLGLALMYFKGWFAAMGESGLMKNVVSRFWIVEHGAVMIVAIVLIHIGYAGAKSKGAPARKFRRLFWCTTVALLLILAGIPWPGRKDVGRPLLPGMTALR